MIELYFRVAVVWCWACSAPAVDLGPGVYAREAAHTVDAQPAVLHWTPEDGFSVSTDVQIAPAVRY